MLNNRLLVRFLSLVSALLLSGCLGGTTPPARFYLLEPSAEMAVVAADGDKKPVVVLAPVRIPHYLDRAQIVTATGENSYQLSEYERWAEGLDHNITRVLQQDLSRLVPADVAFSSVAGGMSLKLVVSILAFHVDAQGQARLTAQWQISRDNQVLELKQMSYLEPVSVSDYRQMVAALNQCLYRLTLDVVEGLKRND